MTDVALAPPPEADSKQHRLLRTAAWIVGTLLVLVLLRLAGIDVWGWFTPVSYTHLTLPTNREV